MLTVEGELLDQPAELARLTGHARPVRAPSMRSRSSSPRPAGRSASATWGNALLTRAPVRRRVRDRPARRRATTTWSSRPTAAGRSPASPSRRAVRHPRAALRRRRASGRSTASRSRILNAHLTYAGTAQRQRTGRRLAARVARRRSEPVVVTGDFNAAIEAPELAGLAALIRRCVRRSSGIPPGDPRRASCGPEPDRPPPEPRPATSSTAGSCTEAGDASDHLPVVATFEHRRPA